MPFPLNFLELLCYLIRKHGCWPWKRLPFTGVPIFFYFRTLALINMLLTAKNQEVGILNPLTAVRLRERNADKGDAYLGRCHILREQEGHI